MEGEEEEGGKKNRWRSGIILEVGCDPGSPYERIFNFGMTAGTKLREARRKSVDWKAGIMSWADSQILRLMEGAYEGQS